MVRPDPKPAARIVDPEAVRRAKRADPEGELHHVVPKGSPYHGDDVADNMVGIPKELHDGWHAGDRETRALIGGSWLEPRHIRYVLGKLGSERGRWFLMERYGLSGREITRRRNLP